MILFLKKNPYDNLVTSLPDHLNFMEFFMKNNKLIVAFVFASLIAPISAIAAHDTNQAVASTETADQKTASASAPAATHSSKHHSSKKSKNKSCQKSCKCKK